MEGSARREGLGRDGGAGFSISELPPHRGSHQVRLFGELDLASAMHLADRLVAIAGSTIVVDLSELSFIDAGGIAAIVEAKQRIEQQGDRLELRGAKGVVARVFEICGLAQLLSS